MLLGKLRPGIFIERPNRFGAWVKDPDGKKVYLHVPNSGRLRELLVPGAKVRWLPRQSPERKTVGDLILVRAGKNWVCIDARMPPRLLAEAMNLPDGVQPFGHCADPTFEPSFGSGRADIAAICGKTAWMIETKSVTLACDGIGMFPDAPTERGRRHVEELAALAKDGMARNDAPVASGPDAPRRPLLRPAVAFICQRADVYSFQPNAETDPAFAVALRRAAEAGVIVVAFRCRVTTRGIWIEEQIPVRLAEGEEQ